MDPNLLIKAQEALPNLPPAVQQKIGVLIAEARRAKAQSVAKTDFMEYVRYVWPGFIHGRHHERMAEAFEKVARGEIKRLIINMPPRHSKSEFASYLFPSWFLGNFPEKKIIQTSHTAELAVGFGRKVRNLVDSDRYKDIFPDVGLQADSKAAGRWATNHAGEYFAIGVGGAVTGKGADCGYFSCEVSTHRGAIPLSEVEVGDYIRGYDHECKKSVWTRVKAISTSFKPELINIGGAWVTPEHRVCSDSGYIRASKARNVAMFPLWEELSKVKKRTREGADAIWESECGKDILFQDLLTYKKSREFLPVWESQSDTCDNMRTVSQPLSSSVRGTSARSLKKLLRGEGYWVVDVQTDTANFFCEGVLIHNCLIIDDPHALEITTPIPTPNGFVQLKDLQIGDEVFGPDGEPTKVVAKSPVYSNRALYEVKTYDGEVIYADAKHLWNVRTSTRVKDPYRNIKTEELVIPRSSPFMIPRHAPVQYPQCELPIDPWVLGAWLGDGTSSLGRMTAHPDDVVFMRGEFRRRGYETTDLADKFSFGVLKLVGQLRGIGVLNNKHIPEIYMTASYLQRMDLLRGLMDTDGNVTKTGQCVFHNKDEKLVAQVVELLHSLGRKCQKRSYKTKGSKFGDCLMHRVTFKLKDCALMPRKRYWTKTTHDKQHRSITVRKTSLYGSVQCITVAREDGLFLAGRGYVVTHNSEQEAALAEVNPEIYDKTYEWYTSGPRQRLQPGGSIVIVATRWSKKDLCAQVLKAAAQRGGDEWEVIEFPALFDSGEPLWPEFWSKAELHALKEELPNAKWMAQYQQNPTSESSAIVKREWWKIWEKDVPPFCEFTLMAWDTAFEKSNRADYSAYTLWGVFYQPDDNGIEQANLMLLNAFRDRMEFPTLKRKAIEAYKEWEPDSVIIEKKASGAPLIYEMRAMGIPVQEYTPSRGNDKFSRLNSVADLFASGRVWAPNTHWAEEVIDEVASFPSGEHDDYTDTVALGLMRARKGGYIRAALDEEEEPVYTRRRTEPYY